MDIIGNLISKDIPSLVMAGAFIYYLIMKDKSTKETLCEFNKSLQEFNRTLTNHLAHQLKTEVQLTKAFMVLSTLIKQLITEEKKK